jgi:hypothetical protein
MLDFSQRWERGKVSLLLLTFSHPSVSERWYWMAVVEECHEGHAYVPKHRTSACRHEEGREGHEDTKSDFLRSVISITICALVTWWQIRDGFIKQAVM